MIPSRRFRGAYFVTRRRWRGLRKAIVPRERRRRRAIRWFVREHGLVVRHGPFEGMRYPEASVRLLGNVVSKLLGSFEHELHGAVEEIVAASPRVIVNIGSHHGYYAIGLALRLPDSEVHAFEVVPRLRSICREIAQVNGVADRIHLWGACDAAALRALPQSPTAVICDCEGCEVEVLRPDLVPFLRTAVVLVELHEDAGREATEALLARFASTHAQRLFQYEGPPSQPYPELGGLPETDGHLIVRETRAEITRWALLTPTGTP